MKNNKLKIVYEDKYLIVVSKPARLLTIANDKEKENTLFHKVLVYLKQKNKKNKVFIVHRLDYDTSGLVIFAKDIKTKTLLQENWHKVIRKYIAIVNGSLEEKQGIVKSYLKETKTNLVYSTNDKKYGLLAITEYRSVLEYNNLSMVEINLKTGRKNQIRVHMKEMGHPIVGDKKYGAKYNFLKRMALHANKLEYKDYKFESEVPFSIDI